MAMVQEKIFHEAYLPHCGDTVIVHGFGFGYVFATVEADHVAMIKSHDGEISTGWIDFEAVLLVERAK
jgi:hypothetical protein